MNILFLSRWFPYPTNNGSKLRIYNLLRGLSQHHQLTLLSFTDHTDAEPGISRIANICSAVKVIPWKEYDPNSLRARLAFFSLKPRSIVDTFSQEMADAITGLLNSGRYDLIIASQLQMAAYFPCFQGVPAIFEEVEVGLFHDHIPSSMGNKRLRHALTWFKLRMYLVHLLRSFRACTVASDRERQLIWKNFPEFNKPVEIIPNCLDLNDYVVKNSSRMISSLIFTGPFSYRVNYDAMVWFVGEVFPRILEKIPDARLIITGDHLNLPLPPSKNITLTGYVEDINEHIAACTVSVAPLLSGGGTRLKILEAMALGTPVVATSKGAEGLDVIPGEHLLQADSSSKFAECVVRLLKDEGLHTQIAKNARFLVSEKYNWGKTVSNYTRLIDAVV